MTGIPVVLPPRCPVLDLITYHHVCMLSHVWLFAALWTVDPWAPLSMAFSRQKLWNGFPCPLPEDLPNPGIKPESLAFPALTGRFFTTSTTWETHYLPWSEVTWKLLNCVWLFVTPWTIACQASLSMGIFQARILEWVVMPSSRDLPNPEIKPRSPGMQADSLPSEPPGKDHYLPYFLSKSGQRKPCFWTLFLFPIMGGPSSRFALAIWVGSR